MKDKIIEGYIRDFREDFEFQGDTESEIFEKFSNYCILSKIHNESFDPDIISVGGTHDTGLDGIAILVNEHIVTSIEDVDFFKKSLKRLDVQFVFLQSKESPKFEMGEISKFIFGVKNFFKDTNSLKVNEKVKKLQTIKDFIYESSIDMDVNPICSMFYITTGEWKNDQNVSAVIEEGEDDLKKTNLFSKVYLDPIDSEKIKNIYRSLRQKVLKEITFEKHTILPKIDKVRTAYIGILPCSEYIELISDSDGNINKQLFYDNVRDFQGHNPVNRDIEQTVKDKDQSSYFSLMNNGITIVAKSVNQTGDSFKIKDFQIVNGCQTSHILHLNRTLVHENLNIPIKLIVTEDNEITNQIIVATNTQTEVKREAFESLEPFHKKLEEFYISLRKDSDLQLYYERRSKQYEFQPSIKKYQVISLSIQVNCFLAMFLNGPHSTHRYYGNILSQNRSQIFNESHSLFPYYVSAYVLQSLENLFSKRQIPNKYKEFKYHLLLIYRLQNEKNVPPPLNSKKIDNYCKQLLDTMQDKDKVEKSFKEACNVLDQALKKSEFTSYDSSRRKVFTDSLEDISKQCSQTPCKKSIASTERNNGVVDWFSDVRGYGFINTNDGNSFFVHFRDIQGEGYKTLHQGDSVSFIGIASEKGLQAQDVKLIQ
jgi:cold shock CspA family protein